MIRPIDLLREGKKEELWQMCCGFVDFSLEQFMAVQKRLLLEQIELLKDCELGKKVMRGAMPTTAEEFREQVPLTTYADYLPELAEQREDGLPAKPAVWIRTSGKTGEYDVKWMPISSRFLHEWGVLTFTIGIFSSCSERGDVSKIKEHWKMLCTLAPRPYTSGVTGYLLREYLGADILPPLEEAEMMDFGSKIKVGFEQALSQGLDGFGGISAILVSIGEQFSQGSGGGNASHFLSQPRVLFRLMRGLVKSKLARRNMLPKDIWSPKMLVAGGTDSSIFREKIKEMWGRYPLDAYGLTEGGVVAAQTWDYEGMTFFPSLNFLEFIPEREWFKWQLDHSYQPKTVLLDEVKAGENYEIVLTNFHGGIMTRCRPGDMVRITSLRNEKLNINIPQMVFERRADDLVDIGLMRLTEKVIWQAIEGTGIPYVDWTARKEIIDNRSILHIYFEPKDNYIASEEGMAAAVYEQIKRLNDGFFIHGDIESIEKLIEFKPVKVTFLSQGAFSKYIFQQQAEGADLGALKPPHINPSDKVLSMLGAQRIEVEAVQVVTEAERITTL